MAQQNVQSLFSELHRLGQNGGYGKALKVANKILQEQPDEEKAFQCKVVCMIQLNKFDEAVGAIKKAPQLSQNLAFEKGYCEYRLFRTEVALKTLTAVENPSVKVKELLAQVYYRLEHYEDSLEMYKDLVKNTQDDLDEERQTNLEGTLAAIQTWSVQPDVEDLGLQQATYEQFFNRACFLLGQNKYQEALDVLKKAEELCREMFEDDQDATEEEIDSELAIIRVQMGYALQMLKKNDEAMKLYNMVSKQKASDAGAAAVASNNIVSINKDQNVFDSKKKMKNATADGLNQKLTKVQQEHIAMNQCLLYMYSNQNEQCQKTAKVLRNKYPESEAPLMIQVALLARDRQYDKAIKLLQDSIEKTGGSINMKLTLAQLQLGRGQVVNACSTLRQLGELSYKPGVVASLVKLYLSIEDKESASSALNSAVTWYQKNDPNSSDLMDLVRANASFQLRYGNPGTACKMLEQMRRENPDDMKILAQLISAYSKFDPSKAQEISRELPSPSKLAADIDIAVLEATVTSLGHKYKKIIKTDQQSPKVMSPKSGDTELLQAKKKKKKKKPKLPKNCDTDTPDSERWLPLRERSYFRGKRRNKKQAIGKGTQGATQGADMDINKSASPSTSQVSSPKPGSSAGTGTPTPTSPGAAGAAAAAATQQSTGPRQQKPQPGKVKKKKKGNKW